MVQSANFHLLARASGQRSDAGARHEQQLCWTLQNAQGHLPDNATPKPERPAPKKKTTINIDTKLNTIKQS